MAECSELVGNGTVSFKCRVPLEGGGPHPGPHMAPEIGRTVIEREAWERRATKAVVETTAQPDPEPAPVAAAQTGGNTAGITLGSFDDFEAAARRSMQSDGDIPIALQVWLTGAAAKLALNNLWVRAEEAFSAGCVSITLTRHELERLVPKRLRGDDNKESPQS